LKRCAGVATHFNNQSEMTMSEMTMEFEGVRELDDAEINGVAGGPFWWLAAGGAFGVWAMNMYGEGAMDNLVAGVRGLPPEAE